MALGAGASRVVAGVIAESTRTTAIGVGAGLLAAAALVAAMGAVLPTLERWSAVAIGAAAALLLAITTIAALVPALRAALVAPVTALRGDP